MPSVSPAPSADVVKELFGARPLSQLLDALDPVMEDVLWAIETSVGEETLGRITAAPRPARELLQVLRQRREDRALADDFRGVVLQIDGLRALLVPAVRRMASTGHESSSGSDSNAGGKQKLPPLASLGFVELPTPDALRKEIAEVEKGHRVSVVVFANEKSSPLSVNFREKLRVLRIEKPSVKFFFADTVRFEMGLLARSLNINCPTTLTFAKDGHRRTKGEDIGEIRDDIENALNDLRRPKPSRSPTVDKRYPRPPPGWNESVALTFWRMLPSSVQGIQVAARIRREVRPLLLHTLPYVQSRDSASHRALQGSVKGVCGHWSLEGEKIHSCMTCNEDSAVDYCSHCFERSQHPGHTIVTRSAANGRCYCDCGTMASGKSLGVQCQKHKSEGDTSAAPSDLNDMFAAMVVSAMGGSDSE
ncbi:hypothetical protein AURDEDRAFT_185197 [Auricularia subglabra TFB-10046 SS5]|nr:hypothetical protein AURDEDRAFT_185197 [Auricularia subglabra TFB-10046 SS5]